MSVTFTCALSSDESCVIFTVDGNEVTSIRVKGCPIQQWKRINSTYIQMHCVLLSAF